MIVTRTRTALAEALARIRARGTVSLVPTMGFLHEGHLSLVDSAREATDAVVATIFVNPLQFGPDEDLEAYPRDEERDLRLLEERGVDLAFVPSPEEMYPGGDPLVTVDPGPMADRLCGAYRPGHFAGVLTVVAKLFGLVRPHAAVFGRKDFQQAVLIRRMALDMELGVRVLTAPIVRERDGLAMSSRNSYLSPEERAQAPGFVAGLRAAREAYEAGQTSSAALLDAVHREVGRRDLLELQYAEVVHPDTLGAVPDARPGSVLALAGFCGGTRLIDNMEMP